MQLVDVEKLNERLRRGRARVAAARVAAAAKEAKGM